MENKSWKSELCCREGVLTLITVRSNDQFNTTIYGYEDRLRGIHGTRRVVLMNEADMAERLIADGDTVDIIGVADDAVDRHVLGMRATLYDVPRAVALATFRSAIRCCRCGTTPTAARCRQPSLSLFV